MGENLRFFSLNGKSPLNQLLISLLVILAGILLFSGLGLAGTLIFDTSFGDWQNQILNETGGKEVRFLRFLLILQEFCIFLIPGIIILFMLKSVEKIGLADLQMPQIKDVILVAILTLCILPIISFAGQINSALYLPDWLSGMQKWIVEKEDNATRIIDILMKNNTLSGLSFNFFVIAILPAIGEELIFRGVFQRILTQLFKSGHLAIWVTAFFFSAIHFQFFGFLPRFILGLVFGYLFFWSGRLWLPVISHFLNNLVSVISLTVYGGMDGNMIPDVSLGKQLIGLLLPILVTILIFLNFRNRSKNKDTQLV